MNIKLFLRNTQKTNRQLIVPALLAVVYFFFMLRFYLIDYEVPDFRLYASFAQQGLPAKDGFSSAFIFMSGLSSFMPRFMTFLCLVMLALSLFFICLFCYRQLWTDTGTYWLMILTIFLSGSWFYFYGKIFYDFPFSVFTFTVAMLAFSRFIDSVESNKWWYITCLLMGFALSWKAYNIFMIAGFGILCLCFDEFRKILVTNVFHAKQLIFSILLFVSGYLVGNYNFFIDPIGTLKGIRGYEAQSSLVYFFFNKGDVIWDHVNNLPFNISIYFIPCMVGLILLLPLLVRKPWYGISGIFMLSCLCIFIKFFSKGYTWHGLTFGIYLILNFCFLIKENYIQKRGMVFLNVSGIILLLQAIVLFGYYIPKQMQWHDVTEEALSIMETESSDIYNDVVELTKENGISDYTVGYAVYRYKPIATGPVIFKKISRHNLYIVPENIYYGSALEGGDFFTWKKVFETQNGSDITGNVVWIIPNVFKIMSDIADIHIYDENLLIDSVVRKDYSIYIYAQ